MWEYATLGVPGGDLSQVHPGVVNSLASLLGDKLDIFVAASAGRASRRWSLDIDGILSWDV